jgi:ornithine racemase
MAILNVYSNRLLDNIKKLNTYLDKKGIQWSLVTKMLNGNREILERILYDDCVKNIHSIADSRISNLKVVRDIDPNLVTMYVKPPAPVIAKSVVQYADISLNSSLETIEQLNIEAGKLGKKHRVIVMIEMGELREGILRDNILNFYDRVFNLPNIEIIGIGTNLGCMYGVEPTYDKLIQLNLYEQLIEVKFGHNLELVSAGSSVTLPFTKTQKLPKGINHFRIGEAAFLGISPFDSKRFANLSVNAFEFNGEVLEIEKKSYIPDGTMIEGNVGHTAAEEFHDDMDHEGYRESYRAIVDFGVLDVNIEDLKCKNKNVKFFGTTSDMTVYDLGPNRGKFKVGGKIGFIPNYMAAARLMNSKYVTIDVK